MSRGYKNDCSHCNGRGDFDAVHIDKYTGRAQAAAYICPQCNGRESTNKIIERSTVAKELGDMTFNSFKVESDITRHMKERAKAFINQAERTFFYIGGNVGTGKTHICMSMVNELAKKAHFEVLWWKTEWQDLKGMKNTPEYSKRMSQLRKAPVLYIDDLLKTRDGKEPSDADFDTLGEIIEDRYNKERITIMSGERTIKELNDMDRWLSSRIYERSGKEFIIKAEGKNQRGRR